MRTKSRLPISGMLLSMLLAMTLGAASGASAQTPQDPMTEGIALFEAGDDDGAGAIFQKQVNAKPGDARAAYYLGRVRFNQGDADGAVEWLEKAVELASDDSNSHLWLGSAYLQQLQTASMFKKIGLSKKVRAEYTKAIEVEYRRREHGQGAGAGGGDQGARPDPRSCRDGIVLSLR